MRYRAFVRAAAPILALMTVSACAGTSRFAATPQRPTYSSDINTTARGTLELESGIAFDPDGNFDLPLTLKWGASARTEAFVGWSPLVRRELPSVDRAGIGDLVLGGRHRLVDERPGRPGVALQVATKLPVADERRGLGSGETDLFGAAILTQNFDRTSVVAYYQLGFIGQPGDAGALVEHGLALAVGHPLAGRLSGFGELTAVLTPEQETEALWTTIGLAHQLQTGIVLDLAGSIGLNDEAPDFVLLFGATTNLGNPFARQVSRK